LWYEGHVWVASFLSAFHHVACSWDAFQFAFSVFVDVAYELGISQKGFVTQQKAMWHVFGMHFNLHWGCLLTWHMNWGLNKWLLVTQQKVLLHKMK